MLQVSQSQCPQSQSQNTVCSSKIANEIESLKAKRERFMKELSHHSLQLKRLEELQMKEYKAKYHLYLLDIELHQFMADLHTCEGQLTELGRNKINDVIQYEDSQLNLLNLKSQLLESFQSATDSFVEIRMRLIELEIRINSLISHKEFSLRYIIILYLRSIGVSSNDTFKRGVELQIANLGKVAQFQQFLLLKLQPICEISKQLQQQIEEYISTLCKSKEVEQDESLSFKTYEAQFQRLKESRERLTAIESALREGSRKEEEVKKRIEQIKAAVAERQQRKQELQALIQRYRRQIQQNKWNSENMEDLKAEIERVSLAVEYLQQKLNGQRETDHQLLKTSKSTNINTQFTCNHISSPAHSLLWNQLHSPTSSSGIFKNASDSNLLIRPISETVTSLERAMDTSEKGVNTGDMKKAKRETHLKVKKRSGIKPKK